MPSLIFDNFERLRAAPISDLVTIRACLRGRLACEKDILSRLAIELAIDTVNEEIKAKERRHERA